MRLPPADTARFLDTYRALLEEIFVNHGHMAPAGISGVSGYQFARQLFVQDPMRLEKARKAILARGKRLDDEVVDAVRTMRVETWFYIKNCSEGAVLCDTRSRAYAVLALNDRLDSLLGDKPCVFTGGVVRFAGRYVCDGLVIHNGLLGSNYTESFTSTGATDNQKEFMRTRPGPEVLGQDHPEW